MHEVAALPLTRTAFAPFGDWLGLKEDADFTINDGRCRRHHDLADLSFAAGGRAALSIFESRPVALPYCCRYLERHPLGSQAFIPMSATPYLVIVAPDRDGVPGAPVAFIADGTAGVNYHRGTWHGVLAPLDQPANFMVLDWVGQDKNLQVQTLDEPVLVTTLRQAEAAS